MEERGDPRPARAGPLLFAPQIEHRHGPESDRLNRGPCTPIVPIGYADWQGATAVDKSQSLAVIRRPVQRHRWRPSPSPGRARSSQLARELCQAISRRLAGRNFGDRRDCELPCQSPNEQIAADAMVATRRRSSAPGSLWGSGLGHLFEPVSSSDPQLAKAA